MFTFDIAIRWLMFMLNPFLAMLFSFKEYMMPYAKNMFWAFCTFYGLTFSIGKESHGSDINRYVYELSELHNQTGLSISGAIEYFKNSGEIDILRTVLSYVLSRFTDSQAILTMVYAFIFGYFFSRNIWYVFHLIKNKVNPLARFLILLLVLIIPIWQIGGFRMWTAFHIFIYGLLPFIMEKKKNTLIFLFLSFFVHFSYIIPIGIFLIYLALGARVKLYFGIFVVSLFISEIDVTGLSNNINDLMPEIFLERTSAYLVESEIETYRQNMENSNLNWYVNWNRKLLSWALSLVLFYLFTYRQKLFEIDIKFRRLLSITLLLYSIANILVDIPSGSRFLNIAFFLTVVLIILYLEKFYNDANFKNLVKVLTPIFLLFIIVSIRRGFYATSVTTIFGNPIFAMLSMGNNLPLNDLIK